MVIATAFRHNDQTSKSNIKVKHRTVNLYYRLYHRVRIMSSSCGFWLPQVYTMQVCLHCSCVQTMIKHQSQTSTCSPISSSVPPSSTMSSSSSCCFWLLHDCNLHMSVHASQFDMHVHMDSVLERTHLQANNSKTASGACGDRIQ